jgi:hypothetical protein
VLFTYFDLAKRWNWEKELELAIGGESPTVRSPVVSPSLPPSRAEVVLQHLFTQGVNAKYVGIERPGRGYENFYLSARARSPSPSHSPSQKRPRSFRAQPHRRALQKRAPFLATERRQPLKKKEGTNSAPFANELHIILLSSIS